ARGELRKLVHMNRGKAQRCVLTARASDFFSEMLLESKSRVQTRDRIKARRLHKLLWETLRVERLLRELFSKTAEGPLAINQPNVEHEKQTQRGPARLIRADFVKMIRMT